MRAMRLRQHGMFPAIWALRCEAAMRIARFAMRDPAICDARCGTAKVLGASAGYKRHFVATAWRFRYKQSLVEGLWPKEITISVKTIKHFVNVRVTYRAVLPVREQILLADVGGVVAV